eukprot:634518-Pleurochrysis_carterae.AAC.2
MRIDPDAYRMRVHRRYRELVTKSMPCHSRFAPARDILSHDGSGRAGSDRTPSPRVPPPSTARGARYAALKIDMSEYVDIGTGMSSSLHVAAPYRYS